MPATSTVEQVASLSFFGIAALANIKRRSIWLAMNIDVKLQLLFPLHGFLQQCKVGLCQAFEGAGSNGIQNQFV